MISLWSLIPWRRHSSQEVDQEEPPTSSRNDDVTERHQNVLQPDVEQDQETSSRSVPWYRRWFFGRSNRLFSEESDGESSTEVQSTVFETNGGRTNSFYEEYLRFHFGQSVEDSQEEEVWPGNTTDYYKKVLNRGLKLFSVGLLVCLGAQIVERELEAISPMLFYVVFMMAFFCIFRGLNMFLMGRFGLIAVRDQNYLQEGLHPLGRDHRHASCRGREGFLSRFEDGVMTVIPIDGRSSESQESPPVYTRTADHQIESVVTHSLSVADLPAYDEAMKHKETAAATHRSSLSDVKTDSSLGGSDTERFKS